MSARALKLAPAEALRAGSLSTIVREALKHRLPPIDNRDAARVPIVLGLIEMRRAGIFKAIFCDAGRLHVIYPDDDVRILTRWDLAERAVQAYKAELAKRKPALQVVGNRRKRA